LEGLAMKQVYTPFLTHRRQDESCDSLLKGALTSYKSGLLFLIDSFIYSSNSQ